MSIDSEEVLDFAEKIQRELSINPDKVGWKGKDLWWYLGQLVKNVRELDAQLTANKDADIFPKTVSIASFALIMANLQKDKKIKAKKKSKKKS